MSKQSIHFIIINWLWDYQLSVKMLCIIQMPFLSFTFRYIRTKFRILINASIYFFFFQRFWVLRRYVLLNLQNWIGNIDHRIYHWIEIKVYWIHKTKCHQINSNNIVIIFSQSIHLILIRIPKYRFDYHQQIHRTVCTMNSPFPTMMRNCHRLRHDVVRISTRNF